MRVVLPGCVTMSCAIHGSVQYILWESKEKTSALLARLACAIAAGFA